MSLLDHVVDLSVWDLDLVDPGEENLKWLGPGRKYEEWLKCRFVVTFIIVFRQNI